MTEAQLLRAFGAEAVRLDPPERVGLAPETAAKVRAAENELRRMAGKDPLPDEEARPDRLIRIAVPLELAGVKFRALMIPDQAGRLDRVRLEPADRRDASAALRDRLEQLLVGRYGRPWVTPAGSASEAQWTRPTTTITLTLYHSPVSGVDSVTILYARRADSRL